jgi:hypothetical protein
MQVNQIWLFPFSPALELEERVMQQRHARQRLCGAISRPKKNQKLTPKKVSEAI